MLQLMYIQKTKTAFFCKIYFTQYLLLIAASSTHGIFVAPNTRTPSLSFPTPAKTLVLIVGQAGDPKS